MTSENQPSSQDPPPSQEPPSSQEPSSSQEPEPSPPSNDLPAVEDAYAPDGPSDSAVDEDDLRLLDPVSRALDADTPAEDYAAGSPVTSADEAADAVAAKDDTSDTDDLTATSEEPADGAAESKPPSYGKEGSAHQIIVELKRIESEVRSLLDGRDSKRKRKLAGTRRWLELEEDLLGWQHSGRIDASTVRRLQDLVLLRHHLFTRLRFIASTRPTWNT